MRLFFLLLVSSLATTVLAQSADLSVTVTMPATASYSARYSAASATGQFTVTNAGPSIAQNVTIDFGSNASSVFLPWFTCGVTDGHYRCTAVSMPPGSQSASFSVSWPLASNGTVETTTVTVSSSSPEDPSASNNSASANTTVVWQANLQLDNVFAQSGAPGTRVWISAYYGNSGPSPATDVKLTISIPPGLAYYGVFNADGLTCAGPPIGSQGDVVCTAPNLGTLSTVSNPSVGVNIQVDPSATPGTVITFPVTLTSTTALTPSQTKSGSLTVLPIAHLHTAISAPATTFVGDTFLTMITVTNDGPAAADTFVTYSPTPIGNELGINGPPGWTCGYPTTCHNSSFAPGTATFTIPSLPLFVLSGTQVGKATTYSPNDPDTFSDVATATTAIVEPPQATVTLTLAAAPDVVSTGDQLTYTATIANTSGVDARNVKLQWTLPGTVLSTTCGTISSPVCTFATIAAGASQTVTSTMRVDAGAGTLLTASIALSATNVTSSTASVTTTVAGTPHADLTAEIEPTYATRAGTTLPLTYHVWNQGPDAANGWQLSFPVPTNTTLVDGSFTAGTGTCTGLTPGAANTPVTCHGTYLAAHSVVTLLVDLAVAPGTTAPIHATATVSTASIDPNPLNNTTIADTPILTFATLSPSMTADKTAAVFGERVNQTFTLTNSGPDTATGVIVNFTIPAAATGVTFSSTFPSCSGTKPITCTAPALAAGASLTATISLQAPAQAGEWDTTAQGGESNEGSFSFTVTAALRVIAPPPPPPARRRAARH